MTPVAAEVQPIEAALEWRGEPVSARGDVLRVGAREILLPGPAVDLDVVGDEVRVACVSAGVRWTGELEVVDLAATATGVGWGTAEGGIYDADGTRVGGVPGMVRELRREGATWIATTPSGVYRVDGDRIATPAPCRGMVTGIARWRGDLVIGTFDDGACVQRDGAWTPLPLPSPMVNDVLAVGTTLYVATAEGLVEFGSPTDPGRRYGEITDAAPRGSPGLNHEGANALATDGRDLWIADVLGPTRVRGGEWRRYRWAVTGHSYQAIAACGASTWIGSEDDGLAVTGVAIGARNGKTAWRQVGMLDGLPSDWIMAIACAGPSSAWVGTYRDGLGVVDASGWHAIVGLEGAWVQAIAVDGSVTWVGTADGVFVVERTSVTKVDAGNAWAILPERAGAWVGTSTGVRWVARSAG